MSRPEAFTFVAGGTVQAGGGVYLERRADDELLAHCRAGDFTYILTSRQMGKSSLMIRTAERLFAEGEQPVVIDLTDSAPRPRRSSGTRASFPRVHDQLVLRTPAAEWWDAQPHHAFAHRFTRYLREVALEQRSERLVVFVDEIDTTLRLGFTDDFFAAIRFLYQNRAADPALQRLSFVLIGVATPGDLIKDTTRTPFNIGHRIDLTDFTLDEAFAAGEAISRYLRPSAATSLPGFSSGRPVTRTSPCAQCGPWPSLRRLSGPLPPWISAFATCSSGPGADSDSNLHFVRDMLTKKAFNREAVLRMYRNIRHGERVPDKELDQVASWLKLSGVVCRRDGVLRVRNAVYEHVFDEQWALDHLRLNVNWRRRLTGLAAVLLVLTVLVTIPLAVYAWRQKIEAEYQAREAERQRDDANRQRVIAENSLRDRLAALGTADKPLDELRRYNPSSAAAIETQIASARAEAEKEFADLTSALRTERDDALRTTGKRQPCARSARRSTGGIGRYDRKRGSQQPPAKVSRSSLTSKACFACTKRPMRRKTWTRCDASKRCRRQRPKLSRLNSEPLSSTGSPPTRPTSGCRLTVGMPL